MSKLTTLLLAKELAEILENHILLRLPKATRTIHGDMGKRLPASILHLPADAIAIISPDPRPAPAIQYSGHSG